MNSPVKLSNLQKLFAGVILAAVLLSPVLVWAQITDFKSLVNKIIDNINYLVALVIGLAAFVFIWGIFKYFVAGADEKKVEEAQKEPLFRILGIFIMFSIWGLVNIVINTFDFKNKTQPTIPQFTKP